MSDNGIAAGLLISILTMFAASPIIIVLLKGSDYQDASFLSW